MPGLFSASWWSEVRIGITQRKLYMAGTEIQRTELIKTVQIFHGGHIPRKRLQ